MTPVSVLSYSAQALVKPGSRSGSRAGSRAGTRGSAAPGRGQRGAFAEAASWGTFAPGGLESPPWPESAELSEAALRETAKREKYALYIDGPAVDSRSARPRPAPTPKPLPPARARHWVAVFLAKDTPKAERVPSTFPRHPLVRDKITQGHSNQLSDWAPNDRIRLSLRGKRLLHVQAHEMHFLRVVCTYVGAWRDAHAKMHDRAIRKDCTRVEDSSGGRSSRQNLREPAASRKTVWHCLLRILHGFLP